MPPDRTPWVSSANAAMLVDLYELTMAASYHAQGMYGRATFDLFVRALPPDRGFLVSCGLADALDYLATMSFDAEAVGYLDSLDLFPAAFLEYLGDLTFMGDVWAIPEGEVAFAQEPIVRISASLIEAQIVETFLLNCIGFQTLIASKAARVNIACGDRAFVDFSPRRDHGADAALKAARAAYIGGASATSNVLAGAEYGLPLSGTMAHSYVMAFEDEIDAFRAFTRDFPDNSVLLIDTFDPITGARRAAEVGKELRQKGHDLAGVRIDSGDLAQLSAQVRGILDDAGLTGARIIASGDMNEHRIAGLLGDGAPIDSFGVGTELGTSGDAPSLGFVYKLVADDEGPKIKLSTEKITLPGVKQVYRYAVDGRYHHDVIGLAAEDPGEGEPLMTQVMKEGQPISAPDPLGSIRARCADALDRLPHGLRALRDPEPYEVRKSEALQGLVADMKGRKY